MLKQIKQVEEFHKAFDSVVCNNLTQLFNRPEEDLIKLLELRKNLIQEETREVCNELSEDLYYPNVAKELADLCYVIFGTVVSLGLQSKFEEVFDEVHRSNMSKLDSNGKPIFREDGKVLKSNLYSKANIEKILE